jgi:hypothetical protein
MTATTKEEYEFLSEAFTFKNHELLQALARGDDETKISRLREEFAEARRVLDNAYREVNGLEAQSVMDTTLRDYTPATDVEVRQASEAEAAAQEAQE